MDKINKIKEWVIINYRKEYILNKFNTKEIFFTDLNYYKFMSNEIMMSVDKRFALEDGDMNSVKFFINKYIILMINGNKNTINENKKQKSEV